MQTVSDFFGCHVFSESVMKQKLPKDVFKDVYAAIHEGKRLDLAAANVVANSMKDWAIELGATHFTHWFQPMTGITAEKHPVKDLKTGRVYITSQNHEYVVCDLPEGVEAAFVNINDDTIEGIRHKTLPIFSVQFHPEACPGPLDSGFLFDRFLEVIERGGDNA